MYLLNVRQIDVILPENQEFMANINMARGQMLEFVFGELIFVKLLFVAHIFFQIRLNLIVWIKLLGLFLLKLNLLGKYWKFISLF